RAGERLLADATDEARSRRAAFVERRLTSGVDYADEGIVRAALDESRAEYQQCVLAGTLAAADTRDATPDAVGEAGRCMRAVSGEARPTALPDVFRPSGLLARECRAVLGAAPQIVAQAEALLAQRREARAAAAAAASTPPARPPEHGPLRDQVLSPRELRAWLGRTYTAERYCHREAGSAYRAASSRAGACARDAGGPSRGGCTVIARRRAGTARRWRRSSMRPKRWPVRRSTASSSRARHARARSWSAASMGSTRCSHPPSTSTTR